VAKYPTGGGSDLALGQNARRDLVEQRLNRWCWVRAIIVTSTGAFLSLDSPMVGSWTGDVGC
jgi:hypothetical protein